MRGGTRRFGALGLLLAGLLLAAPAGCTGPDTDGAPSPSTVAATPAPPSSDPGAVFSVGEDVLCEWVTADDVAVFFEQAYGRPTSTGPVTVADPGPNADADPRGCTWELSGSSPEEYDEVIAATSTGDLPLSGDIDDYSTGAFPVPGGAVSGHPALSEGVVVRSEGWGVYTFWMPPADNSLTMSVTTVVGTDGYGVDSPGGDPGREERRARFFTFADLVLRDLGWAP